MDLQQLLDTMAPEAPLAQLADFTFEQSQYRIQYSTNIRILQAAQAGFNECLVDANFPIP